MLKKPYLITVLIYSSVLFGCHTRNEVFREDSLSPRTHDVDDYSFVFRYPQWKYQVMINKTTIDLGYDSEDDCTIFVHNGVIDVPKAPIHYSIEVKDHTLYIRSNDGLANISVGILQDSFDQQSKHVLDSLNK